MSSEARPTTAIYASLGVRLAIGLLIALYAVLYGQWFGTYCMIGLLVLTCLALVFPIAIELDRIGQIIMGLLSLVVAYVLAVGIGPTPPHPISKAFSLLQAFTCVWTLTYASLRLFLKKPMMGHKGTILLIMVGVFVCGGSRGRLNYHAFVAAFMALGLLVVYLDDPTRPSLRVATPRRRSLLGVALLITTLTMGGLWVSLPVVYEWASKKLGLMLFPQPQTGFDMFFKVGSLRGVIKSKRVVLRVKGPYRGGLHMRGVLYNRYRGQCWLLPRYNSPKMTRVSRLNATSISASELRSVDGKSFAYAVEHVSGDGSRYFVPLESSRFATPSGMMRANVLGVAMPTQKDAPELLGFQLGSPRALSVKQPGRQELLVPKKMRATLRKLALAWTQGIPHNDTLGRMAALRKRLMKQYRYSLSFERPKGREPILDFLLHNKQGHCEYFASALALLARSIGISTRVAGGYLASEYSTMGGYYIIRDQNAHAWVEAWLPGKGWRTYDATPSEGLARHMPSKTSFLAGLLDFLQIQAGRFRQWLGSLSYAQLFLSIGAFLALWIGIRLLRRFRNREQQDAAQTSAFRDPLPAFEALLQALSSILPKNEAESLERYAARLRSQELPPRAHQAAVLVMAYASFRYGQIGEQADLEQQIHAWLEQSSI